MWGETVSDVLLEKGNKTIEKHTGCVSKLHFWVLETKDCVRCSLGFETYPLSYAALVGDVRLVHDRLKMSVCQQREAE